MKADIKVMLDSVIAERAQIEQRLATLKQREDILRTWLREEQPTQANLAIEGGANGSHLSNILRSALSDGNPHSIHELAGLASARGLVKGEKSAGRVVHFALVGLQKHGYVRRTDEGSWVRK